MNPLLSPFPGTHQHIPFDKIKSSDFVPALQEAIREAKKKLEEIKGEGRESTFENSVEPLEASSELIGNISNIFFALHSAESDEALRDVAKEFSPLLTDFSNDILLDPLIFEKVKRCYQNRENFSLNPEQNKLVEEYYLDFVRNGALLDEAKKKRLREVDQNLSRLSLEFGDNVLKDSQKHFMIVDRLEDLKGLPQSAVDMAAEEAKARNLAGKYVFTLDFPSFSPFMKYAENRDLRKKLFKLYSSRAFNGDESDNRKIIREIVELRFERARILGYQTHAHFVLERRMCNSPEKVRNFLQELLSAARPVGTLELQELETFASSKLERWDYSFYAEKLKKKKYSIDDEILRPYFRLENVVGGIFQVAKKLYDISFTPVNYIPAYHPDVKVFEVRDDKTHQYLGLFYTDFHPRKGKKNGAWMTGLKDQKKIQGIDHRPHVSIVCNFTKPTATTPSLLSFDEVGTLFHEFGHALHMLLTQCQYARLSGTNVYWDFVELPSQIMENWIYEKECLDLFAGHYQTGEKIPEDLIQKIRESFQFHEGYATLRQLSFAYLDLKWHDTDPGDIKSVEDWEWDAIRETSLLPPVEGTNLSCSFSHIFSGGYSAGYYSYKWAEVLDADAFQYFKEKGIFNQEVASRFREFVLARGGTEHPQVLYKKFRGGEASIVPLLKRAGLWKKS